MKPLIIALAMFAAVLPAFAENAGEEAKVGETYDRYIRKRFGVYPDEKVQRYVRGLGQKLVANIEDPEFQFKFTVLDDPIINAFAVPGGYVYITRGMLAYVDNEAELAAVMGHEVGHVIGHHSFRQMKKSMGDSLLIFAGLGAGIASNQGATNTMAWVAATSTLSQLNRAGYGRALEMEADEFGLLYAYDSGYDPREMQKLFKTLQFKERVSGVGYHGFLASHPDTVDRIVRIGEKGEIIAARGKATVVKRDEYLAAIEGLSYGKADRAARQTAPYKLAIHSAKTGDSFRALARDVSKDEALAFEIAVMNGMRENDEIPAGLKLKIPAPFTPPTEAEKDREPSAAEPVEAEGPAAEPENGPGGKR